MRETESVHTTRSNSPSHSLHCNVTNRRAGTFASHNGAKCTRKSGAESIVCFAIIKKTPYWRKNVYGGNDRRA